MMMIDNVDYDLCLIAEVERNPILYDSSHADFRCTDLKQDTWKEITYRLRQTSDESSVRVVRNRWKSLRDSLVKEMRLKKNSFDDGDTKPRKRWRYSNAMTFLIPHLIGPNPAKGNRYKMKLSDTEVVEPMEKYLVTPEQLKHIVDDVEDLNEVTTNGSQEDEIDSFFKGIADTVKKLSPENQVKVQRDIVNLVLDSKLWEIQEAKDSLEDP